MGFGAVFDGPEALTKLSGEMGDGEKMANLIIKVMKVIQKAVHPLKLRGQLWALYPLVK